MLEPTLFRAGNWTSSITYPNELMRVASHAYTGGPDESGGLRVGMLGAAHRAGDETDARGVGVYGSVNQVGPLPEPTDPTGVYGVAHGNLSIGVKGHAVGKTNIGVLGLAEGGGIGVLGEGIRRRGYVGVHRERR